MHDEGSANEDIFKLVFYYNYIIIIMLHIVTIQRRHQVGAGHVWRTGTLLPGSLFPVLS